MTIFEAIILGAIQGIFMFFPVSSTSHLALAQQFLIERGSNLPTPDSAELILFDLIVHVGTLASIGFVFRKQLKQAFRGIIKELSTHRQSLTNLSIIKQTSYVRLSLLSLVSLALTGVVGLIIITSGITVVFDRPVIIAINLIITGLLLWWTDSVREGSVDARSFTLRLAIIIGIAQGFALLPGLSRSGLTIAIALYLGLKRHWAATYSFFLAIPTILAASLVQFAYVITDNEPVLTSNGAFAVAFVVAAIVGAGALTLVLTLLYRARFRIFSLYVWFLAALVLLDIV